MLAVDFVKLYRRRKEIKENVEYKSIKKKWLRANNDSGLEQSANSPQNSPRLKPVIALSFEEIWSQTLVCT